MIYLILAIFCSGSMALSIKYVENRCGHMKAVTVINYIVAAIMSFIFMEQKQIIPHTKDQWLVILLSIFNGCLFLGTMYLLQLNVKKNGTTISALFSRLGVLVPTILSIFVFREFPQKLQWVGVIIAISSIVVINYSGKSQCGDVSFKIGLILLFICAGSADMMSKIFQVYGDKHFEGQFLFYTFCMALIISIVIIIIGKISISGKDIKCGILVGSFNYLSTLFLLKAVIVLPAYLVYPVYSVGVILFVSAVNIVVMKEPINKREYIGMAMICIALVFLNINV